MNAYQTLKVEKKDALWLMTINRPEKYNAINDLMAKEMEIAFHDFADDQKLRVGIITGAGKAFMSGADIAAMKNRSVDESMVYNRRIMNSFSFLEVLPKPVIAAINGFAFGGGLELALACTFRLAASEAKMGLPEVRLGILPGTGGTQRLPRTIGKQQALRLLLTGETIGAAEALRLGIVMEVVPAEELMARAQELAKVILDNGPRAVSMVKDAVEVGMQIPLDKALAYTDRNLETLLYNEEMKEGVDAFLEHRPPSFAGK
jgi:enoyl-CoA hydratase